MNSHYAPFALMLVALCQLPTFITCMALLTTAGNHWLRGAIRAIQKKQRVSAQQSEKITRPVSARTVRVPSRTRAHLGESDHGK